MQPQLPPGADPAAGLLGPHGAAGGAGGRVHALAGVCAPHLVGAYGCQPEHRGDGSQVVGPLGGAGVGGAHAVPTTVVHSSS